MSAVNASGFYRALGAAGAATFIALAVTHAVPHVEQLEGRSLTPYYDIAHVLTYCDGETLDAKTGSKYTNEQCDSITEKRTKQFATYVAGALQKPVSEPTFIALTIFSYNVGVANFKASTALRKINAGDTAGGCEAMMKFSCITVGAGKGNRVPVIAIVDGKQQSFDCRHKSGGFDRAFSKGLANRRAYERKMCLNDQH